MSENLACNHCRYANAKMVMCTKRVETLSQVTTNRCKDWKPRRCWQTETVLVGKTNAELIASAS
ncbi:hypothetical protein [Neptuniibacter sp. QD37_11]|uniref:hypothetical protein n=1 Tax=Neptuniibacter sp. QD37_11 TaxID=3398209 RepID=UPI0039F625A5